MVSERRHQHRSRALAWLLVQALAGCAVTHVPDPFEPGEGGECQRGSESCDETSPEADAARDTDGPRSDAAIARADAGAARDASLGGDAGGPQAPPDEALLVQGTLISFLGSSSADFIVQSHKLELLDAKTGQPLTPAVTGSTAQGSGKFTLRMTTPGEVWVHVIGNGPASQAESTYDSVQLWTPRSGDTLVRISQVGTAATAEVTGGFSADPARVSVQGAVYRVDGSGRRTGSVGCAEIYLDDLQGPATAEAQRYIMGVLPTTLDRQDRTQRSGKWFFGNIAPGLHTFRVSVDHGKTFLASKSVYIPFARSRAFSEFKAATVSLGIDVPGPDPMPASCPQDL